MGRTGRRRLIWALSLALVVLAAVVVAIWVSGGSSTATGDPGGKVLGQLTPSVSALPGYGTASLPWVSSIPQSLDSPYVIKWEPHQDSCDGMPSTRGWGQAGVQAGFQWSKGMTALIAFMDPRLANRGWSIEKQPGMGYPPNQNWTKTLSNGTKADLSVTEEGGNASTNYELVALGNPMGKAASGC